MKKVLLILLMVGFGFWGCSENTSLTEPTKIESQRSFLKVSNVQSSLLKESDVSKEIDGERGGIVFLNLQSEDEEYGAKGWIYFPRNSFEGVEVISATINDDVAAIDFEPGGLVFDKPARLTLKFSGLEFDDDDHDDHESDGEIDFQFINENGDLETVDYRRLIINKRAGWAIVVNAEINHFSRYGFTK
jgi:hypothetical protein